MSSELLSPTSEQATPVPTRFGLFRRKEPEYTQPWEEARVQEAKAALELLKERRRKEQDEQRIRTIVSLWPLWLGVVLAAFSPLLKAITDVIGPWTTMLVFPYAALAERPELQVGPLTHLLPTIMLYAQFPIEGLLARIILRRPVLPISVAVQVLLFHFLGIVEVWMLYGAGQPILHR